ncbi:hypothetical protein KC19_10G097000 [Ceratodon purpureus]|uniref:Membrane protein insertion efficiency factor n=1 Tax=Ceratodon purpureus TaxID=3225 RepID=A0A8T0GNK5_CERPU|nr:hypothetical protein KC19_10G097000 [Ceratodon purpureus]
MSSFAIPQLPGSDKDPPRPPQDPPRAPKSPQELAHHRLHEFLCRCSWRGGDCAFEIIGAIWEFVPKLLVAMAALVPPTDFATAVSGTQPSSGAFRRLVPSQVQLRVPASSCCGSVGVFSRFARVVCQGLPVRSDSASTRVKFCSDSELLFLGDDVCSSTASELHCTSSAHWVSYRGEPPSGSNARHGHTRTVRSLFRCNCTGREDQDTASNEDSPKDAEGDSPSGGVAVALKILQFYKREISPLLPGSCRFVPTCSEYGMQAFKKYGVVKGTILTAWRLSRCNPLGGSGFDPPRWFDEPRPPPY